MVIRLKKGDQVDILAPGSFIDDEENLKKGIEILKNWGLKINQNNSLSKRYGYFAGDDLTRFKELEKAQNSKLIIFAKGGWGSSRILEKNPSWGNGLMLGFSDTCSLLLSKYSQGFIGSIHGPMVASLFKEPEWSLERLRNLLFEGYVEDIKGTPLRGGKAKGEIIVSNLTIATFLIGTNHFPDCIGKIIIFEDINEDIYKIDRMLTYLRMTKTLTDIAGIGFGSFSNDCCDSEWKDLLKSCIIERLKEFNFPIIFDLPIGHISGNACIPLGYEATLNGDNGILSVEIPF
ncbi:Muramoyltetrapeptide carboxypeptidase [Prochlorococcus marinus str. MIT 9302]|uniref:Muramoyltetrapeptide carboxypeptidase n=1 Tax=Prochlorococcus marinus str. MIT 9302 TaxID=74545 RepID=A0A0A2A977_PROMR|nr:LD-carboxypeptidase [Prochlorococcus marinus]KGF97401.1 Muramoyltetrapeptide carboxypeptidase [Prochlorococcus marinus str. MIT 9302]